MWPRTNTEFAEVDVVRFAALFVLFIAVSLRVCSGFVFRSTFYERNVHFWRRRSCKFLSLSFFSSV